MLTHFLDVCRESPLLLCDPETYSNITLDQTWPQFHLGELLKSLAELMTRRVTGNM